MALHIPTVTVDDLRAFRAKHFSHAPTPENFLHGVQAEPEIEEEYYEEDDGLGYYPDGMKRTLTDEQIAMFRHSEIQEIIRKRRLKWEDGELSEDGEAPASPAIHASDSPASPSLNPTTPDGTAPSNEATMKTTQSTNKVHSGRVEKPKTQQWATTSARTRQRNKKHNQKYRKKKQEERKRKEAEGSGDDDDSDEWDPWHQANGPDVQKDDTVDLDY